MKNPKLTIVAFFHFEAGFAVPLLNQLEDIKKSLISESIETEIILNIDRPDNATRLIVSSYAKKNSFKINETNFGNAGGARDEIIDVVSSDYVLFIDGDDLISENWPLNAFRQAELDSENDFTIYHPEFFVSFNATDVDTKIFLNKQIDSNEPNFHILMLGTRWYYCNNIFCKTKILKNNRFPSYNHSAGIGSEDWEWSIITSMKGIKRAVVSDTVYFYRRKHQEESVGSQPGLLLRNNSIYTNIDYSEDYLSKFSNSTYNMDLEEIVPDNYSLRSLILRHSVSVSKYDLSIYGLIKEIPILTLYKQSLTHGTTRLLAEVIKFLAIRSDTLIVFSELNRNEFLSKASRYIGNRSLIYITSSNDVNEINELINTFIISIPALEGKMGVHYFKEMIFNVIKNNSNIEVLVDDGDFFDIWFYEYRKPLASSQLLISKIISNTVIDLDDGRFQREKYTKIISLNLPYTKIVPEDKDVNLYLSDLGLNEFIVIDSKSLDGLEDFRYKNEKSNLQILGLSKSYNPDISLIVTLHNEGRQLISLLFCIVRAINALHNNGKSCEILINCDNLNLDTEEVLNKFKIKNNNIKILNVGKNFSKKQLSIGAIRNKLAEQALGRVITFCDGDDHFSQNWLSEILNIVTESAKEKVFYFPEFRINYDSSSISYNFESTILKHVEFSKESLIALLAFNQWPSIFAANREFFLVNRFDEEDFVVYEDWKFYADAIVKGFKPVLIPETMCYVRSKKDGVNYRHNVSGMLFDNSRLLDIIASYK